MRNCGGVPAVLWRTDAPFSIMVRNKGTRLNCGSRPWIVIHYIMVPSARGVQQIGTKTAGAVPPFVLSEVAIRSLRPWVATAVEGHLGTFRSQPSFDFAPG